MRRAGGIAVATWLVFWPAAGRAQTVEVTPFAGYRFGGDFFEIVTGQAVDLDGAQAVGAVVNVKFGDPGNFFEALFTHQEARLTLPGAPFAPPTFWRIDVDHWLAGGLHEFGTDRQARPFLTGLLGMTRYAAPGDDEFRFAVSVGAGVKLMPVSHLGARIDARVFTTFADIDGQVFACAPGGCFVALDADVIWQAEFSVGLVVAFP